ncbi:MATH domain and coiled-coil domain-containing protein At3g58370-like [Diospyros lotus]|uniref:MATH domain and coiled-coil domain-containing protein At3g58370-like n=1 Tax=Diospyros lotus TaxID=55363 RepID=UPI00225370E2|nr:MATH domain and coiled-coil domain-containing protein At3g58370-like [Diospyros lotus]
MGLRFTNSQSDVFTGREAPPIHYLLKIQSFNSLSRSCLEKYSSDTFDVGDYKWRLKIYPRGNKDRGGQGHISIFLTLANTSSLPVGWELHAMFNFFVYDQHRDKYFSLPDNQVRRFHVMKTEWGEAKFVELQVFNDSSNGYLIDDACVFGAEVYVLKMTRKAECLSTLEKPNTGIYTWTIKPFSALTLDRYESQWFVVGGHRWRIRIYPHGLGEGKGNSVSAYLSLDESTLPPDTRLVVRSTIRVLDQNEPKGDPFEDTYVRHFGASFLAWGVEKFMSLAKLNDPKQPYLVEDTCVMEAEVTLFGTVSTAS